MFPANFGYVAARSLDEALQLLNQHGEDAKLLAGGHSLLPAMKLRLASPRTLIDLGTVPGLSSVRLDGDKLAIGAMTVHADVGSSDLVRKHFPMTPRGIIDHLKLRRPIYRATAAYGHFGRNEPGFTWEKTDKAKILAKEAGL